MVLLDLFAVKPGLETQVDPLTRVDMKLRSVVITTEFAAN
jgi:hypothetical protein